MENDNSCLFHALHDMLRVYCVESPYWLRELVSNAIIEKPEEYQTFLTKPLNEYVQWITKEMSWGGAVELGIVAKRFNIEIDAIDVEHLAILRFNHPPDEEDEEESTDPSRAEGEIPNPTARGIVCYNGIHYDLFAFNTSGKKPAATDITLFDMDDPLPLAMAYEVCKKMRIKGDYVDQDDYEVVCNYCGKRLIGNTGVLEHGEETSHYSYSQVK